MTNKQTPHKNCSDLLLDEKFLRWRIFPDAETDKYWHGQLQEDPSLKDKIALADDYIKKHTFKKKTMTSDDRKALFTKIQESLEQNEKKRTIRTYVQYAATACAAIALLIIGTTFYRSTQNTPANTISSEIIVGSLLQSQDIQLLSGKESHNFHSDIEVKIDAEGDAKIIQKDSEGKTLKIARSKINRLIVPYGKRTQLTLADGSMVWLNSGSILEFPSQFVDKNRKIRLVSGEMYIEVAPDKKRTFYVKTSDFNVQVLGTKFNITAYVDAPKSVVLAEGRIVLQSENGTKVNLAPNEQATFNNNLNFNLQKVNVNQFISWKNGYMLLENTPILYVLKKIERYYNLSFNFDKDVNLQSRTCTGKIYLSDNLDNVMTTVALLSSTTYKKENNQIYITTKSD